MGKDKKTDDLVSFNRSVEPIIIHENKSYKKFLYTIVVLLVILFIIAIAIIVFLGSKYFNNNFSNRGDTMVNTTSKQVAKDDAVKRKAIEVAQKNVGTTKSESNNKVLAELESLVKEEEQKTSKVKQKQQKPVTIKNKDIIAKVATASTGKKLSQEDLEKIAKLVAKELSKTDTKVKKVSNSVEQEQKLVASLKKSETDTLKETQMVTTNLKDAKVNSNSKKVDAYNKVIIKKNNSDGELAKLSSEIDSLLETKEVFNKEKSLRYGKELKQEIKTREQEMRFITVKRGDTLSSLAKKAYGKPSAYIKIYKANPDIVKNPNIIYVGMKLRVPLN